MRHRRVAQVSRALPRRRAFTPFVAEPDRAMTIVWRVVLGLLIVLMPLALWSGYRAIVQVFSLDVEVRRGADGRDMAVIDMVGSGRATLTITTEVVDGIAHDTVHTGVVPTHVNPTMDPRPIRKRLVIPLAARNRSDARSRSATLRVTALGRSQWLRTPPPTVRDIPIRRASGAPPHSP